MWRDHALRREARDDVIKQGYRRKSQETVRDLNKKAKVNIQNKE